MLGGMVLVYRAGGCVWLECGRMCGSGSIGGGEGRRREKDGQGREEMGREKKGIEWFGDWVVRGGGVGSRVVWVMV